MHINLELLETVYLTAAMLLEVGWGPAGHAMLCCAMPPLACHRVEPLLWK